ncbi:MAG: OmpA family protein [Flavobacteriaceae bacterium]|nr:OmpA family protein [Flavobacteriaceae bacterium]
MKKLITPIFVLISILMYSQTSPGVYTIKNAKINTKKSDFGTAFFGKDKVVFASPKQGISFTREMGTNQPFLDLFIGEVTDDGKIIKKEKMSGDINTKYNEGMVSFSKDMKTVYFSANRYFKKKKNKKKGFKSTNFIQLFKATINEKGDWTNLTWLPFNSTKYSTGHPTLNIDDSKLYFVSDRPESIGKTDLYVVDILDNNTYSEPRNLGPKINTVEREMFPFISNDNVLYFSSDGHLGFGELDVFASKIYDTTISDPISLETPVNSEKDDFAYIINDEKHIGYFSSNRSGGKGNDDIYSFSVSPPIFFECQQEIIGVVKDIHTQEIIPGALIVLFDDDNNKLQSILSNKNDATFSFDQNCDTPLKIEGYLQGQLIGTLELKTVNDIDVGPLEVILQMDTNLLKNKVLSQDPNAITKTDINTVQESTLNANKITASNTSVNSEVDTKGNSTSEIGVVTYNNSIQINSIYFDFNKYDIRYDAKLELDKIYDVMEANPELEIDINAHTDSRGTHKYNMSLSNHRAKATIAYLVKKGIGSDRISGKGFGEEQLATNCPNGVTCTNFQHQLNRRSEFSLMQDGLANIILRSNNILNSNLTENNNFTQNSGVFINYDFSKKTAVYTVQIGAFQGKVQTNKYSKLTNLFNHRYSDGFNRYYSGIFETSTKASVYLKTLKKAGFEGAFVIGLEGSERNF